MQNCTVRTKIQVNKMTHYYLQEYSFLAGEHFVHYCTAGSHFALSGLQKLHTLANSQISNKVVCLYLHFKDKNTRKKNNKLFKKDSLFCWVQNCTVRTKIQISKMTRYYLQEYSFLAGEHFVRYCTAGSHFETFRTSEVIHSSK